MTDRAPQTPRRRSTMTAARRAELTAVAHDEDADPIVRAAAVTELAQTNSNLPGPLATIRRDCIVRALTPAPDADQQPAAARINQSELARRIGLTPARVWQILRGHSTRAVPKVATDGAV